MARSDVPSRTREWLELLGLLLLEAILVLVLYLAGRFVGSVSLAHFGTWVHRTAPGDAIAPLLRLGGLVVSSWLLATTLLYAILAVGNPERTARRRSPGLLPPRVVRRIVDGIAAASIVVSAVSASAGLASAAPVPAGVTARPLAAPAPAASSATISLARPTQAVVEKSSNGREVKVTPPINSRVVGRHLPHPGPLVHQTPLLAAARPDPTVPSGTNGFAGLTAGTKFVVVKPGDCLSVLAQDHLGNWQLDHEITALNVGRIQPDGHQLRDEHWIYPGWVLVMPARAVGALTVGSPSTAAPTKSAPDPSAQNPTTAKPAEAKQRAVEPVAAKPGASGRPTLTPATTRPPYAEPAATRANAAPTTTALSGDTLEAPTTAGMPPPPTMVALATTRDPANGNTDERVLVEAGLMGAAVLTTVGIMRRRQAQHRPAGRRIRLPDPATTTTELTLRRGETPDRVALVERALSVLVTCLREQAAASPPILGLLVDDDSVEVLLAIPATPPSPWRASAEGFRWRIHASDLPTTTAEQSAPLPALTSLGRVAAGTADALINLEAAGLVGISGDPARAVGLLCAAATHLIGAPWAKAVSLILVAFPPGLANAEGVRCVDSILEVADELRATSDVMLATVRRQGCTDVFTGRLRGLAGDGWPPVVILSARKLDAEELQVVTSVARPGRGIAAAVVNAGSAARWEIDAGVQPCPVNPLRLAVEPTVLKPATMAAIAELIQVAQDTSGAGLDDSPYDQVELSVERAGAIGNGTSSRNSAQPDASGNGNGNSNGAHAAPVEPPLTKRVTQPSDANHRVEPPRPTFGAPPILVRVLGSVEVEGSAEWKRAKSRELVVYLAMHPNGVGEAELDEALWGSQGARVVVSSTRDATVSVARTALGGAARLLPAQGQGREKRYQLGPEVQSDWGQFCTLHRFGRDHRSTDALRQALELVRGRPFEGVVSGRTYGWIHTEGHGRHIEAEVADAADLAARLYLDANDPMAARWAARRGLIAEPYTERLWTRLMEAADILGESQEIERIMDEMDVVLELEGDFSGLHPNTLATYDRLSRRHRHPVDM